MTQYDKRVEELRDQCSRKAYLFNRIQALQDQKRELSARVRELEAVKLEEQADVDRLEGGSLAAFFYNVIGKMDEKLTKEREEAYAARVKYDAAAATLVEVQTELDAAWEENRKLQGCEQRLDAAIKEKATALKAAGGAVAEELLSLEQRRTELERQRKELQEAVSAGRTALRTADQVLSSLGSAEGWGTWDLFGGGMISDLAKHSHLDEAQRTIQLLQSQLRRFKTELADVTIYADLQVGVDGFLRFADYFFDGLFADWAVMNRIHQSQDQVQQTRNQIANVLSRLERMLDQNRRECDQNEARKNELVFGTDSH